MNKQLTINNLQFTSKKPKGFTLIRTLRRKNLISVQRGFTLIELLVVISIIGILAAMATLSFTGVQKQARDTARKSDLVQYRTALESFANKNNGLYPTSKVSGSLDSTDPANLCTTLGLTNCPSDPKSPAYAYSYLSAVGSPIYSAAATTYILWAKLENISDTYWVVCSSGESGKVGSAPTGSTGSTCPTLTP